MHGAFLVSNTHRENYILLNSVQEFIEIEARLLLTFSLCLHDQFISIHSIVTYSRKQMFEKCDSLNRQNLTVASFSISARFSAKFGLVLVLAKEKVFS